MLLSRTPATKGLPLGVVQTADRWSMSCANGSYSLSQNASSMEGSPKSPSGQVEFLEVGVS